MLLSDYSTFPHFSLSFSPLSTFDLFTETSLIQTLHRQAVIVNSNMVHPHTVPSPPSPRGGGSH